MVLIMNYFDRKYDFSFWKGLDMPDIYKLTFDNTKLIEVNKVWEQLLELLLTLRRWSKEGLMAFCVEIQYVETIWLA